MSYDFDSIELEEMRSRRRLYAHIGENGYYLSSIPSEFDNEEGEEEEEGEE